MSRNYFDTHADPALWKQHVYCSDVRNLIENVIKYLNAVLAKSRTVQIDSLFDSTEMAYQAASWFFDPDSEREQFRILFFGLKCKNTGLLSMTFGIRVKLKWIGSSLMQHSTSPSLQFLRKVEEKHSKMGLWWDYHE